MFEHGIRAKHLEAFFFFLFWGGGEDSLLISPLFVPHMHIFHCGPYVMDLLIYLFTCDLGVGVRACPTLVTKLVCEHERPLNS